MSLNELVDTNFKPWLNPTINSIKIDGDWTYHTAEQAPDDNLVLDANLVARWTPIPPASPYGNGIGARINAQSIKHFSSALTLSYLAPFSPLFSFEFGSTLINVTTTGNYLVMASVGFNVNVQNSVTIEFKKLTAPNTYSIVPGSKIASFPGTTLFGATGAAFQSTIVSSASILSVTAPNTPVGIFAFSTGTETSVNAQYSTFTIIRISDL